MTAAPLATAPVVAPAGDWAELCFHGLAHLPLPGVERLYEPRLIAACAGWPERAREPLVTDAPAIAAMMAREGTAMRAQSMPLLHGDLGSFLRSGPRELMELGAGDAEPSILSIVRGSPAIEWLRADLLLIAEAFDAARDRGALAAAAQEVSGHLAHRTDVAARTEVSWALGPRGRGFSDRVVVGAPAPWWCRDEVDRAIPAVLALHEHAVLRASGDYVSREWAALVQLARALEGDPLGPAHRRWLAGLDLSVVLEGAVRRGLVSPEVAGSLASTPARRPELLASAR